MKIVVNKCFGGYSLSPKAVSKYYELQGIPCYHFKEQFVDFNKSVYTPIEEGDNSLYFISFSVSNPNEIDSKELWEKHYLSSQPEDRTDPLLIQAIEEVGENESSGSCAALRIIEIPDDLNYEIDDYDGMESIHEVHRSW